MRKIGKLISMLIIMTFLCQNVGFCLPESNSTLRLPVNGSHRVEETIKKQGISINDTIEFMLDMHASRLSKKRIAISTELTKDLPHIPGDEIGLKRVGLIINAIDSMQKLPKERRKLSIKTMLDSEGNNIEVRITNTGVGIPKENLRKIFIPYFTTKKDGTSLGMSSVREVIEEYDGTVSVESEVDKGTTFIITLPVLASNNQAELASGEDLKKRIKELKTIVFRLLDIKVVALDFDHTISSIRDRVSEPTVAREIIKLLELGIDICIATVQWDDEMQEHFIDELRKYKEFKPEYLPHIHLYVYSSALGFNAKEGPARPYYKHVLSEDVKESFRKFFLQKGWLDNPDYLVVARDCQIIVRRTENPNKQTALKDRNTIEKWLKAQNFQVSTSSGSITCTISPSGVSKLTAVEDILQRFKVTHDNFIKIGDMGHEKGNDYEFLRWLNSFTVDEFDPDNPNQIRVSEILGIKGPKATSILLELLVEKVKSQLKDNLKINKGIRVNQ
ncbi:MAG: HAD hydrolase family protein [Candidatus Omnitrophica bacterium]|nr:HAD hydrolase family protein [Candidatus Omnitrophota bacterium]